MEKAEKVEKVEKEVRMDVGEGDDPDKAGRYKNRGSIAAKRLSMSAKRASFFIGDDQKMVPVKIVGPDDEEIPGEEIPVPPDGGYGWIIVLAAFFSNVIVDGIVFSFGALKDDIQNAEELGDNKLESSTVALIGSLLTGFYLLTGPFVSAIANRYGFRTVAILGSLIACGGFTMAWFLNKGKAPNVSTLVVFYGIVGGIGFSCIYVPAVIAVGFYFEKRRALATGIAICGSGIGNFIFPILITNFILPTWGWQTTILTLGLIVLSCGFLGLLYKPLTAKKSRRNSLLTGDTPEGTPLLMRIKRARDMMKWDSVNSFVSRGESMTDIQKNRKYSTTSLKGASNPIAIPGAGGAMQSKRMSVPTMLSTTGESPSFPQAVGILVNAPQRAPSLKAKSFVGLPDLHEIEEEHGSDDAGSRENSVGPQRILTQESKSKTADAAALMDNRNASIVTCRIGNSMLTVDEMTNSRIIRVASRVTLNKPLYRDDIFYSGSLLRIPDYANNVMTSTEWTAAVTRPLEQEAEEKVPKKPKCCCCTCEIISKMLDFSLLLSPTFIVFAISGMFTMLGMFVPFVFLPDQANSVLRDENGEHLEPKKLSFFISLIGIANTVGRIIAGWVADRPFVNALILNNGAVTIMGLSTAVVPLLNHNTLFMMYALVFGMSMACFASLRSILVVELLGLAKLTNAFGLLLLFQGLASIAATPMAGFLSTNLPNGGIECSKAFYFAGACMLISAIMCYPLNKLNKWEKNRKMKSTLSVNKAGV